jgi:hypothetical protein
MFSYDSTDLFYHQMCGQWPFPAIQYPCSPHGLRENIRAVPTDQPHVVPSSPIPEGKTTINQIPWFRNTSLELLRRPAADPRAAHWKYFMELLEERLPAVPARLKVARILLGARAAKNRTDVGRGTLVGPYQIPRAVGIPVVHYPDLGIRFAEGDIPQPALGILVENPRLNAGPRQQIGNDMCVRQVGSGIHPDHATSAMEEWRIASSARAAANTLEPYCVATRERRNDR